MLQGRNLDEVFGKYERVCEKGLGSIGSMGYNIILTKHCNKILLPYS